MGPRGRPCCSRPEFRPGPWPGGSAPQSVRCPTPREPARSARSPSVVPSPCGSCAAPLSMSASLLASRRTGLLCANRTFSLCVDTQFSKGAPARLSPQKSKSSILTGERRTISLAKLQCHRYADLLGSQSERDLIADRNGRATGPCLHQPPSKTRRLRTG